MRGADAVVNLVGILQRARARNVRAAHVEGARKVVDACTRGRRRAPRAHERAQRRPAGAEPVSALKGEAEALVAASGLAWTIFRPSVIFGRGDAFLSLFAKLLRLFPALALAAPDAKFQPVYVGDVAHCFAHALDDDATIGQRYNLCGPNVYTLAQLVALRGRDRPAAVRPILRLGPALSRLQARVLELVAGHADDPRQPRVDERDAVCDGAVPAGVRHRARRARGDGAGVARAESDPQPLRSAARAGPPLTRWRRRTPPAR